MRPVDFSGAEGGYEFVIGTKPIEGAQAQSQGAQCPNCKTFNPTSNKFCGKCGAVMQKKTSRALVGCLVPIGIILLITVLSSRNNSTHLANGNRLPTPPSKASASTELFTPRKKPEPSSQWAYSSGEDSMGRKQAFARVSSTNALEFGFPYQGSQHGTVIVRRSAQSGTSAMLLIERGQFLCGFEGCNVNIRFDTGPIQRFSAGGPSDHSTTVLFLNNESRFISQLRKAKALRIEPTFYHEGLQTLEFDVDGFKWP